MAGIDKIYLTDWDEYTYFRNFLEKHELEFFKKHKYSLSCCLFDYEKIYFTGKEIPVSNFSTEADVFIIQHLSDDDFKYMPNVINRLKEQYSGGNHSFDLIREHNSVYDKYQIDFSGCNIKLIENSNNKTLRHIKRERWEYIDIFVNSTDIKKTDKNYDKYFLDFNYYRRIIFNKYLGCKYYKYYNFDDDTLSVYDSLHNISIRQVYNYITRVRLKRGIKIEVLCRNCIYGEDREIIGTVKEARYLFIVV